MTSHLACFSAAVVALCLVAAGPPVPPRHTDSQRVPDVAGGPYCGVYCVYSALRSLDVTVRFETLLSPQFVGSFYGSTARELQQAVESAGGQAVVMENLTASALWNSRQPIILHVRRPGLHTTYAHWVLFLGVENGQARIVDPPHGVELLSFAELLSLWDGVGIVVSADAVDTVSPRVGAWLEFGAYLVIVAACLGILRLVSLCCSPALRYWPLALILLPILACGLAALSHGFHEEGMLRNPVAVAQVVGRHFEPSLPRISLAEAAALHKDSQTVFLDARTPDGFAAGHIPGAVNLPVYSGLAERRDVLNKINPEDQIIIYCHGERCEWGETLAADLVIRGHKRVAIFRGGWVEWQSHDRTHNEPK